MDATTTGSDQQNLDALESSHMYSLLFKEIVSEIDEDDAKSVKDLVAYCHGKGISETELKDFQREYHQKSPIWWYTSETFLHSMVDHALQLLDMETMVKMGFFIRSLHRQLEQLYNEQSNAHIKPFVVYRGQELSQEEFEHLLAKKGGLFSFNNFLLTSTQKHVAMEYIQRIQHKYEDHVDVVFVMTIDPSKISASTIPFAFIDKYSAIPQQQEVLFSTHTVFRVGEIKQAVNNSHLWEVQLTLTNDNDPELAALTQRIREEIQGSTGWDRMAQLMVKVGQFDQAEEIYKELLNNSSNDTDREHIYHQFGEIKNYQGEYEQATSFYEKSLAIKQKTLPADHPSLASTFSNIGGIYNNMGDYSKALEFYEKSHKIFGKVLPSNHPNLAASYDNIGQAYNNMGDYQKALEFYQNGLKINEKALPPNHPSLATSYNNIGQVYDGMGDYAKALSFLEKALAIQLNSLPPSHPLITQTIDNIDRVKKNM